jgi:alkaline phosphatase
MKRIKMIMKILGASLFFMTASLVAVISPENTVLEVGIAAPAQSKVRIRLPERFRVLTDQLFDLRVEAAGLQSADATLRVLIDGADATSRLPAPEVTTDNDADASSTDKAWTFRKVSFPRGGVRVLQAVVTDGAQSSSATARIGVQPFRLVGGKNVILFIGDGMGAAYRDAARIVAKSTNNRFREGFFDEMLNMDLLPVSGMVLTHAMDRVTPDSANTASAWATGNKTIDGATGVFPDNNDFKFKMSDYLNTRQYALDNPRIETLWEYLKRLHGYSTGIVTTADVTDATPAGEGGHTITRALGYDIAKQYVDGVFTDGPAFDVIMGGGKQRFVSRTDANSGDRRNLAEELKKAGYAYVETRGQLKSLPSGEKAPDRVLGLFRSGNMNVAYDKLGLERPADEPRPIFGGFNDQPFLDEMAARAIATLAKRGRGFILMIEGASIDKQSHGNHMTGQIWDTIELDKAVGVARDFMASNPARRADTLVVVTADHDQSMTIIGRTDTTLEGSVENTRSTAVYPKNATSGAASGGANPGERPDGFPDYEDANGDGYPENKNRYRIAVGYRTGNHAATSVPITAGGAGALLFTGYFDQTDVFFKMARALSADTSALDRALRLISGAEDSATGSPGARRPRRR